MVDEDGTANMAGATDQEDRIMPRASIEVTGKSSRWGVTWDASKEQIEAMQADGIDVGIVENSIPLWVVEIGCATPWCFMQDIWNLKNPFRR
jgi:hypothetical protein